MNAEELNKMTHFWCETCNAIRPVIFDKCPTPDISRKYVGGDICCEKCSLVIATCFVIKTEDVPIVDEE